MALLVLAAVALSACGVTQPFSKAQPLPPDNAMVAPPWEARVAAGPGASQDIDLETLNGPGAAPPQDAAPPPDTLAGRNPGTAAGAAPPPEAKGPAPKRGEVISAVAVIPVQGGTPKANAELTQALRQTLRKAGWKVITRPAKNALLIWGQVTVAAPAGGSQNVALVWTVVTPAGKTLGDVKQANDVPAGSLDRGWGANAAAVTDAAAGGLFDLINKYR